MEGCQCSLTQVASSVKRMVRLWFQAFSCIWNQQSEKQQCALRKGQWRKICWNMGIYNIWFFLVYFVRCYCDSRGMGIPEQNQDLIFSRLSNFNLSSLFSVHIKWIQSENEEAGEVSDFLAPLGKLQWLSEKQPSTVLSCNANRREIFCPPASDLTINLCWFF